MRNSIQDYIGKSFPLESYSVGFLHENKKFKIKNTSDAEQHLSDVTQMIQNMVSNSSYYENIDPKELFEIALYFSDKLQPTLRRSFFYTGWDFNGGKNNKNFFGDHLDWIKTFFTKINECSARLHMASPDKELGSLVLKSHISLKFLFILLEYYNALDQTIGERYIVEFTTEIEEDSVEMTFNNKTAKIKVTL